MSIEKATAAVTPIPWRFSAEIGAVFARVNGRPVTVAANVSPRNGYILAAAPVVYLALVEAWCTLREAHTVLGRFAGDPGTLPALERMTKAEELARVALLGGVSSIGGGL